MVDMPMTDEMRALVEQLNQLTAGTGAEQMEIPESVTVEFDFSVLKDHEMSIKIDAGASSYYSEIASLQTLDNLLLNNRISTVQYLERIPDGNIAGRRKLIDELKEEARQQQAMQQQQMQMQMQQQMMQAEQQSAGAPEANAVAETGAREEQRSTGFRELGEALRSIGG